MDSPGSTSLLRQTPLLNGLPDPELERLAASLRVVSLDENAVLFREGEAGETLYILIEGRLEVLMGIGTSDETRLATLGPGESIGEMSLLLPGGLRTASVRAAAASRLWTITRADFDALLVNQPRLAYSLVQMLTRRLDSSNNATFRDLQEKNRKLQVAYDELKAAQAQLIEKERLERELQVAAEIQVSILPQQLPRIPGYDFGTHMQPARMVGGDFYDVFELEGDQVALLIGDVADKGIPSAIFMARAHALIAAEARHGGSPAAVLQRVNYHLIQLAQSDLFVTVLFGMLDCKTGNFDFARAGHELPLLVTAERTLELPPHKPGQAIGLLDEPVFDEGRIYVPPGGILLAFTDGLSDGRSPASEPFGRERIRQVLTSCPPCSAQQVCDRLVEALQVHQAGAPQDDDVTLVAVRSNR
jgi:serine phosphatase RsbU (regulator of sigma subunit)